MKHISEISPEMTANNFIISDPTHPGEFLREEIDARGITQTRLANEIGVKVSLLNELINGKRDFTIEYAMMIEAALGIDADFWINQQASYNKAKATHDFSFMSKLAKIRNIAAAL
ncbi:MAG: HigA family addiction module antidote protein [Muribaculaceae bacterium]|nr:HigA family addiction module antidote protein [Muribaculaceae bacterium]